MDIEEKENKPKSQEVVSSVNIQPLAKRSSSQKLMMSKQSLFLTEKNENSEKSVLSQFSSNPFLIDRKSQENLLEMKNSLYEILTEKFLKKDENGNFVDLNMTEVRRVVTSSDPFSVLKAVEQGKPRISPENFKAVIKVKEYLGKLDSIKKKRDELLERKKMEKSLFEKKDKKKKEVENFEGKKKEEKNLFENRFDRLMKLTNDKIREEKMKKERKPEEVEAEFSKIFLTKNFKKKFSPKIPQPSFNSFIENRPKIGQKQKIGYKNYSEFVVKNPNFELLSKSNDKSEFSSNHFNSSSKKTILSFQDSEKFSKKKISLTNQSPLSKHLQTKFENLQNQKKKKLSQAKSDYTIHQRSKSKNLKNSKKKKKSFIRVISSSISRFEQKIVPRVARDNKQVVKELFFAFSKNSIIQNSNRLFNPF